MEIIPSSQIPPSQKSPIHESLDSGQTLHPTQTATLTLRNKVMHLAIAAVITLGSLVGGSLLLFFMAKQLTANLGEGLSGLAFGLAIAPFLQVVFLVLWVVVIAFAGAASGKYLKANNLKRPLMTSFLAALVAIFCTRFLGDTPITAWYSWLIAVPALIGIFIAIGLLLNINTKSRKDPQ